MTTASGYKARAVMHCWASQQWHPIALDGVREIGSGIAMLTDSQRAFLQTPVRTMQILVGAMTAGVVMFGGIAFTLNLANQGARQAEVLIAYLAAGIAFAALVASLVVPAIITSAKRQQIVEGSAAPMNSQLAVPAEVGDAGLLAATYQTRLIVAAGLLEGAAFFNLIAYMLEGQTLSLVATGVMLLMLLSLFPTRARLENWIDSELTAIAQLREMRSYDAR